MRPGGPGALPTFSALPGPPGGPSPSTAIVKLGAMDMAPRKAPDSSLPVCINYLAGACMSPRECGRWHPEDVNEVTQLLETFKRKPCMYGRSCRRPRCVFWHPENGPLPDFPGEGLAGFTGFTGLVPAAGTEPGAFQKPLAAGERLMIWGGTQGQQEQAARPDAPESAGAEQAPGPQASAAEAPPRVSSEEEALEAQLAMEAKQQKKQRKQPEEQSEENLKQIEAQNEEIQRLRNMLSTMTGSIKPPKS